MTKMAFILATLVVSGLAWCAPASAAAYSTWESCHYPHGWNITDFERDLNGTPEGRGHQCLDTYVDGRLVRRIPAE